MQLYPHQQSAVGPITSADAFLLADEPGLGKTPTLSYCAGSVWNGGRVFVVSPRNVVGHWKDNFKAWAPNIFSNNSLQVTNYEKIPSLEISDVKGVETLILDESHKFKNENSSRLQKFLKLWEAMNYENAFRGRNLRVWLSSGTPVYSYPLDLFTSLVLMRKLTWNHAPAYKARYCNPTRRKLPTGRKVLDLRGASNLEELQRLIAPFTLRRTWKDAGIQMPPLTLTDCLVKEKITDPDYFTATANFVEFYLSHGGTVSGADMARFTVLRRILATAKAPIVAEQAMDDMRGEQNVLNFTEFRDSAQLIHETLLAAGFPSFLVLGGQSKSARDEVLNNFKTSKEAASLTATTDSLGEGTDGLQEVCHLANFVDLDFEPAMFVQALRRVFRINQRHPVNARRFIVEGDKMEAFITENVYKKNSIMRKLGLEDSASLSNLSGAQS